MEHEYLPGQTRGDLPSEAAERCRNCGEPVRPEDVYCPHCGETLLEEPEEAEQGKPHGVEARNVMWGIVAVALGLAVVAALGYLLLRPVFDTLARR